MYNPDKYNAIESRKHSVELLWRVPIDQTKQARHYSLLLLLLPI